MITLTTRVRVDGLKGKEVTDFLLQADDEDYRRWWRGTHLKYHTVRRVDGDVGNLIYFEEFVGRRHERTKAVVVALSPGRRLVMQMKRGIRLPIWLELELEDDAGGVTITQRIRAGYEGAGRVLDPILRRYFSREYHQALDEHAWTEFPMLRDMLHAR
jgi:uncharacterized protein YndB with AHSA1/START domain